MTFKRGDIVKVRDRYGDVQHDHETGCDHVFVVLGVEAPQGFHFRMPDGTRLVRDSYYRVWPVHVPPGGVSEVYRESDMIATGDVAEEIT